MENFQDMADQFIDGRAAVQVDSGDSLGKVWTQLIQDAALRERMGNAARKIAERNRGAANRTVERIVPFIDPSAKGTSA
jgi:3-deoxy-D-manno-octulosonic-acid transferase